MLSTQNRRSPTICVRDATDTSRIPKRRSATCSTTASRAKARKLCAPTDCTSTSTRARAPGPTPRAGRDAANRKRVRNTNFKTESTVYGLSRYPPSVSIYIYLYRWFLAKQFLFFLFFFYDYRLCSYVRVRRSETERRLHVSQREDAQQPGPERRAPRVRASGWLSEVLRVPQRHHASRTGMLDRRSVQRGVAKVRPARERARMVSGKRQIFYAARGKTLVTATNHEYKSCCAGANPGIILGGEGG